MIIPLYVYNNKQTHTYATAQLRDLKNSKPTIHVIIPNPQLTLDVHMKALVWTGSISVISSAVSALLQLPSSAVLFFIWQSYKVNFPALKDDLRLHIPHLISIFFNCGFGFILANVEGMDAGIDAMMLGSK